MGNDQKKPEDYSVINSFKKEEWINKQSLPHCEVWENKNTQLQCQVYEIPSNFTTDDLDNYEIRNSHDHDLVKVHHIATEQNKNLCSRADKAHALIQRIPYRLDSVQDLTQIQALTVMRSAYKGYNTISSFYGPIQPYEDMIGFNERGRPKVWLNSNLAKNKPEQSRQENPTDSPMDRNQIYVRKIFNMIQSRTINRQLPLELKNKFRENNPNNFFQAFNNVEQYAEYRNIEIPEEIRPRVMAESGNFILPQQQLPPIKSQPSMLRNSSYSKIPTSQPPPPPHFHMQNLPIQRSSHKSTVPPPTVHKFMPPPRQLVQTSRYQPSTPQRFQPPVHDTANRSVSPNRVMVIPPVRIQPKQFLEPRQPPAPQKIQQFASIHSQSIVQKQKKVQNQQPQMIFSFNNKNGLQSNLVQTIQSQQVNIPRYSVVESQQTNSPVLNQSPLRQERQVQVHVPTVFEEPSNQVKLQPIQRQLYIEDIPDKNDENEESEENQEQQIRYRQTENIQYNEENVFQLEEGSYEDNSQAQKLVIGQKIITTQLYCDEQPEQHQQVERIQVKEGHSVGDESNCGRPQFLQEDDAENVQNSEQQIHHLQDDEREYENVVRDQEEQKEEEQSFGLKRDEENDIENQLQRKQSEEQNQGYNYRYRESEVEKYQGELIGDKQLSSHHSIGSQEARLEKFNALGIQRTISVETPIMAQLNERSRIPQNASYENIQEYIKNKFKDYIRNDSGHQGSRDVQEMAHYVENKYNKIKQSQQYDGMRPQLPTFTPMEKNIDFQVQEKKNSSEQHSQASKQIDILDVKMMERSLDKKYNSIRMEKKGEETSKPEEQINVKKLQENLIRFEESRVGNKFAVSEVSKIGSLDEKININTRPIYEPQNYQSKYQSIKSYQPKKYEFKSSEKEHNYGSSHLPSSSHVPSSNMSKRVQNYATDIDQKYDKYVSKGSIKSSQVTKNYVKSSRGEFLQTGKSSNYQYQDYTQWNRQNQENYHEPTPTSFKKQNYEGKSYKNDDVGTLSYEDLRKFIWS